MTEIFWTDEKNGLDNVSELSMVCFDLRVVGIRKK